MLRSLLLLALFCAEIRRCYDQPDPKVTSSSDWHLDGLDAHSVALPAHLILTAVPAIKLSAARAMHSDARRHSDKLQCVECRHRSMLVSISYSYSYSRYNATSATIQSENSRIRRGKQNKNCRTGSPIRPLEVTNDWHLGARHVQAAPQHSAPRAPRLK